MIHALTGCPLPLKVVAFGGTCVRRGLLVCNQTEDKGREIQEQRTRIQLEGHRYRGAWWHTPVIPVLGRLRQEERLDLKASLCYMMRPCLRKTKSK